MRKRQEDPDGQAFVAGAGGVLTLLLFAAAGVFLPLFV
jgi:hypothetical protein